MTGYKQTTRSLLIVLSLVLGVVFVSPASLASEYSGENTSQSPVTMTSVRRNIATILLCGLGGAVLGLSSMSFYNDPQNHVGNITSGLGLGLIAGVGYVSMNAANGNNTFADNDMFKELQARNAAKPSTLARWTWDF